MIQRFHPRPLASRRIVGMFGLAIASAVLAGCATSACDASAQKLPWSSGPERPRTLVSAGAVDAHNHIYETRFPSHPSAKMLAPDALQQFGPASRGAAVSDLRVSDAQLRAKHAAGVLGLRFNFVALVGVTDDMTLPLSRRIAPLGWKIQINATAAQIVQHRDKITAVGLLRDV